MSENTTDKNRQLGDYSRAAWRALYDLYAARVWRYVAKWIGADSQGVAEIVQETFLATARNWSQFDESRGTVGNWLLGIAHRQTALWWRKRTQHSKGRSFDGDEADFTETHSPIAALELSETVEQVRRVLSEMNGGYAALLTGKYCDGLSTEQLVAEFGGSLESVRSKLARARRDFRSRLTDSAADLAEQWLVPRDQKTDERPGTIHSQFERETGSQR